MAIRWGTLKSSWELDESVVFGATVLGGSSCICTFNEELGASKMSKEKTLIQRCSNLTKSMNGSRWGLDASKFFGFVVVLAFGVRVLPVVYLVLEVLIRGCMRPR